MNLTPEYWLETIRKEYLQDFIRGGGAVVKFIVPTAEIDHAPLQENIRTVAEAEGYLFALVDSERTKIHMIDHIFHSVATQVDTSVGWDELAFSYLKRLLSEKKYKIPESSDDFNLKEIARLNGRDEILLRNDELNPLLEERIFRDYQMCQEFRIAMLRLCQFKLDPLRAPIPNNVIKYWLCGKLRKIAEIKPALIFQKVARHNARHMLSSFSYWLHLTGKSGLVLLLDITRCLVSPPRPKELRDDSNYYSTAATQDTYEVLRQFIDATDDLEFCFIVVIAPPEFLDEENKRGLFCYNALKLRIWDEIRDKKRANPLSALIRLAPIVEAGPLP